MRSEKFINRSLAKICLISQRWPDKQPPGKTFTLFSMFIIILNVLLISGRMFVSASSFARPDIISPTMNRMMRMDLESIDNRYDYNQHNYDPHNHYHYEHKQQQRLALLAEQVPVGTKRIYRWDDSGNFSDYQHLDLDEDQISKSTTMSSLSLASKNGKTGQSRSKRATLWRSQLADRSRKTYPPAESSTPQRKFDCTKLATVWASFSGLYPNLAAHLVASNQQLEPKNDGRAASSKGKGVAHLLDQIERQLSDHPVELAPAAQSIASFPAHLEPDKPNQQPTDRQTSAWISRVSSNPMYAKLIQHIYQQQQMRQRPSTEPSNSNPLAGNHEKHVYGRLIHYPHEINQPTDSVSVAKTLDKLRQLSLANEINKQQMNNEIENNQISPLNSEGGDGDPRLEKGGDHRRRPQTTDSETSRNNFVYGNVLLQPKSSDSDLQHPNYMNILRHLDKSPSSMANNANPEPNPTRNSYGRIVVSPPNDSSENRQQQSAPQIYQTGNELGWSHHEDKSTLNRLRQQLRGSTSASDYKLMLPSLPKIDELADELATQEYRNLLAVNSMPETELAGVANNGNTFEGLGEFSNNPHAQISVRKLRSELINANKETNSAQEKTRIQTVKLTTANPGDIFLVD